MLDRHDGTVDSSSNDDSSNDSNASSTTTPSFDDADELLDDMK